MKKILATILLSGLFLATTSPVFAETINGVSGAQSNGTTPVDSAIAATYTVTIPATLSIDLMSETPDTTNATGAVTLDDITAAGAITVGATVEDLTLTGGTGLTNETLTTTIAAGADTPANSSNFSLTDALPTTDITVNTAELSKNNLPGAYTGAINFTFDYAEATAE